MTHPNQIQVFANSTCFDDALMSLIAKQAKALRRGAYILTLTKPIQSTDFKQVGHARYKMCMLHRSVNPALRNSHLVNVGFFVVFSTCFGLLLYVIMQSFSICFVNQMFCF
jgi:hypothetical protein